MIFFFFFCFHPFNALNAHYVLLSFWLLSVVCNFCSYVDQLIKILLNYYYDDDNHNDDDNNNNNNNDDDWQQQIIQLANIGKLRDSHRAASNIAEDICPISSINCSAD